MTGPVVESQDLSVSSSLPPASSLPLCQRRAASLYIHIPFCARICPYCDFAVSDQRARLERRYMAALKREAQARLPADFQARTVFIGGGTPTELCLDSLRELARWLKPYLGSTREFTIEGNPGTLRDHKLEALKELGVTRVSLGAQSMAPKSLEQLGRVHRREHIPESVERLRAAGFDNLNLDLMFAIPGQSLADLHNDLDGLLALSVEHISAYGLTYEPGTPFFRERRAGRLRPVQDELEARMFTDIRERLQSAGYQHYEISNYARPGRACAHNRVYWRNGSYYGLGNGSASHIGGWRLVNERDPERYIAGVEARGRAFASGEFLTTPRKLRESAYLSMRTARGLRRDELQRDFGFDGLSILQPELDALLQRGFLEQLSGGLRLASKALVVADQISMELL